MIWSGRQYSINSTHDVILMIVIQYYPIYNRYIKTIQENTKQYIRQYDYHGGKKEMEKNEQMLKKVPLRSWQ